MKSVFRVIALGFAALLSFSALAQKANSLFDVRTVYMTVEEANMAESCVPDLTKTLKRKYTQAATPEEADAVLEIRLEGVESMTLGDAVKFQAELKGADGAVLWRNAGKERSLLRASLPCSDVAEEIIEEMHDETT